MSVGKVLLWYDYPAALLKSYADAKPIPIPHVSGVGIISTSDGDRYAFYETGFAKGQLVFFELTQEMFLNIGSVDGKVYCAYAKNLRAVLPIPIIRFGRVARWEYAEYDPDRAALVEKILARFNLQGATP